MLKKEETLPGSRVTVNDVIKDGVPANMSLPGESHVLESLTITKTVGGIMTHGGWSVGSGTELEIVKKPRRVHGINSVRVRVVAEPEVEGEVYWCELRASCTKK
ncbi:hypothetical protein EVC24_157 [Rhizobium phage RHph_I4]|nr:hypothetical protein EVC24_157 [Rhizobium phage RHph_I4]